MKNLKFNLTYFLMLISLTGFAQTSGFYDFKVKTLEGKDFDFASLKGKKVMIVNTASKCGFTPQYKDLEETYQKYQGDLVIIGFPANNFLNQEPGSAQQTIGPLLPGSSGRGQSSPSLRTPSGQLRSQSIVYLLELVNHDTGKTGRRWFHMC